MQVYSDEQRETDEHALPDVEVWYEDGSMSHFGMTTGYYWWSCFPGCMPDSDPIGPFDTEEEAIADARGDN